MAAKVIEHCDFKSEKNWSIITCKTQMTSRMVRSFVLKNWKTLSPDMKHSTILIMAGIHGSEGGQAGGNAGNFSEIQNQVRFILKSLLW